MHLNLTSRRDREAHRGPERPREGQRDPEEGVNTKKVTHLSREPMALTVGAVFFATFFVVLGRGGEAQRGPERAREGQRGPEAEKFLEA